MFFMVTYWERYTYSHPFIVYATYHEQFSLVISNHIHISYWVIYYLLFEEHCRLSSCLILLLAEACNGRQKDGP